MSWLGTTGSGAYDDAACPPRRALPQAREPAGEYADRGNELHLYAQRVALQPERAEEFLEQVSVEYRHTARGMNVGLALDGLDVIGLEVSFVLNVKNRTCRMIGADLNRKYVETLAANGEAPLDLYDIPFTVDVHAILSNVSIPVELDYKSGQSIGEIEFHGQRRISAAGLMFFHATDTAVSRVAYIADDGSIRPDGFEFSILDAWETCDKMVAAIDAIMAVKEQLARGETPTVSPNRDAQCQYCPAFNACPYWTNLVKGALGKTFDEPTTPEEQGQLFDQLKDLEKVIALTVDRLKESVLRSPLPVDEKFEFRAQEKSGRSYFDAAAARGLLKVSLQRLGHSEEEIDEVFAGLNKQGAPVTEVRKRKRLAVVAERKAS